MKSSKAKSKPITYWQTLRSAAAALGCDHLLLSDLRANGKCPTAFRSGRIYDSQELRKAITSAGQSATTAEPLPDTPILIRLAVCGVQDLYVGVIENPDRAAQIPAKYRERIIALVTEIDGLAGRLHELGKAAFPNEV